MHRSKSPSTVGVILVSIPVRGARCIEMKKIEACETKSFNPRKGREMHQEIRKGYTQVTTFQSP